MSNGEKTDRVVKSRGITNRSMVKEVDAVAGRALFWRPLGDEIDESDRKTGKHATDSKSISQRKLDRIDRLTAKVVNSLRANDSVFSARAALSHLRRARPEITDAEVMEILKRLEAEELLAQLLKYRFDPSIYEFLLLHGFTWNDVLAHWKPSLNDAAQFLGGLYIGTLENFVEGIRFIAYLTVSPFIDNIADAAERLGIIDSDGVAELVEDRDQFWNAIGVFVKSPIVTTLTGVKNLLHEIDAAFARTDFFEAGRKFAIIVVTLIALPSAVRTIWRLVGKVKLGAHAALIVGRRVAAAFAEVSELTAQQVLNLIRRIDIERLMEQFIDWYDRGGPSSHIPAPVTITDGGVGVMTFNNRFGFISPRGQPLGTYLMSKLEDILPNLQEDLRDFIDEFEDTLRLSDDDLKKLKSPDRGIRSFRDIDIRDIPLQTIERYRADWKRYTKGNLLTFEDYIRYRFASEEGLIKKIEKAASQVDQDAGRIAEDVWSNKSGDAKNNNSYETSYGNVIPDFMPPTGNKPPLNKRGKIIPATAPGKAVLIADTKILSKGGAKGHVPRAIGITEQTMGFVELAAQTQSRTLVFITQQGGRVSQQLLDFAALHKVKITIVELVDKLGRPIKG
jgi:hypothetical protein